MKKIPSIYEPVLAPFLDRTGSSYVGDRKAVALIYQRKEKTLERYFEAVAKQSQNHSTIQKLFNRPQTRYDITPLHVAVMTGQLETAKKLLMMKVHPNRPDHQGWTPLHHAAVLDLGEMIELLKQFNASDEIKNYQECTPSELAEILHPKPLREKIYQVTESGDFEEMDPEQFKTVTGARYIDQMVVTSEVLAIHWGEKKSKPSPLFEEDIREQYHNLECDRQTLALQVNAKDEHGRAVPIGASVVAKREIKKGELIAEYLGVLTATTQFEEECGDHKLDFVDGEKARNLAVMCPDGLPNAYMTGISNLKGLFKRSLLVATRDIPQNTPVAWDYGPHAVKRARIGKTREERKALTNRYIEIFPTATQRVLKNNRLQKIFKQALSPNESASIDHINNTALFSYIMNTPVVFLKHALNGNIQLSSIDIMLGFHSDAPFTFRQYPEVFQIEPLLAVMQNLEKYTLLRSFLLAFLNRGYLNLPISLLLSLSDSGIEKYQDVEGFLPDDFDNYRNILLEFAEEGKPLKAFDAAVKFFSRLNFTVLSAIKNQSKRNLKWTLEKLCSDKASDFDYVYDS